MTWTWTRASTPPARTRRRSSLAVRRMGVLRSGSRGPGRGGGWHGCLCVTVVLFVKVLIVRRSRTGGVCCCRVCCRSSEDHVTLFLD